MKARRISKKASTASDAREVTSASRAEAAPLPQGSTSDQDAESAPAKAELAITPLEYMLAVMRDPAVEPGRRDEMAKLALPYMHPKVSPLDGDGRLATPADPAELSEVDLARRVAFTMALARRDEPDTQNE